MMRCKIHISNPEAFNKLSSGHEFFVDFTPVMRCKMRVSEVMHVKDENGNTKEERVKLTAVYGPEGTDNARWSKWTPAANFDIHISNPEAFNKLSSGHEFFVDFTPVQ